MFFGLAPFAGFVPAVVVVVLVAVPVGAVDCGVVADAVEPFGEVAPDVEPAGVVAGAGVGNEVKGVGSGGNGLDRTEATNSVMPASDALCRYLYQVERLSCQACFGCANAWSLPANATALA